MVHRFYNYLLKNQVILALFLILAGWIIIQIRDILLSVFLAYIIVASILPVVNYLQKKGLPRIIAVAIPYSTVVIAVALIIVPLFAFFIEQIQNLIVKFPFYLKNAAQALDLKIETGQIQTYITNELNNLTENAFTVTTKVFGGVFSLMMIMIVSFYLLFYYNEFKRYFSRLFNIEKRSYVLSTLDKVNDKLGYWLRGQIFLMIFIGTLTWIALTIFGIPNALPLALLAGLLEIIPTIGPIVSSIPAIIIALTISPAMAGTVAIAYIIIQLIENNLLVPKVMQKAVGLNPVAVILAVLIGGNLMGVSGALLAIPLTIFILIIIRSLEKQG